MTTITDLSIRQFVYSLIEPTNVGKFLDIGCGKGYDLIEIASLLLETAEFIGIEKGEETVAAARQNASNDPRISLQLADIAQGIPLADNSIDVVFSKNVLECIIDKDAHLKEIHRVLKPGGQVICAHYDWDSQVINGSDKDLTRRIVHAFSDCKQKWMDDCDSWIGRRLWGIFNRSGLFTGQIHAKVLTETDFVPGTYGYESINSFEMLVRRGLLEQADFDRFKADIDDIEELYAKGEYFYSITMYVYVGKAI